MSRKSSAKGAGALVLILACFGASGAARLNDVAPELPDAWELLSSRAWAQGGSGPKPPEPEAPMAKVDAMAEATPPAAAGEMSQAKALAAETLAALTPEDRSRSGAAGRGGMELALAPLDTFSISTGSTPDLADRLARLDKDAVDGESADLLKTLQAREQELNKIAAELERRRLAVEAANRRIEERLGDLERAKEELATLVASIDKAASRDVEHLIAMYEKMKPKEAGALFNTMEPSFASGFLARMRPDRAAAIMAKMDPQKAYAVSAHLAGRNVRVDRAAQ